MSARPAHEHTADGPTVDRHSSDDQRQPTEADRRVRRARVFGDVLPDSTGEERGDDGAGAGRRRDVDDPADEWLRRQVPPHHG